MSAKQDYNVRSFSDDSVMYGSGAYVLRKTGRIR